MDDIIIPARFAFRIINFLAFMIFGALVLYMVGRILLRLAERAAEIIDKWFGVSNNDRPRPPRPPRPTQPPSQPPDWR